MSKLNAPELADLQEFIDKFYFDHKPCCAGCDWWRHYNSMIGECGRGAPVSGVERTDVLGIHSSSLRLRAGHVFTNQKHVCGDFKDTFDWSSLPLAYRKRVGAPL